MLNADEAINEFLVESHENLDQLDRDFVALEAEPTATARLAGIFRTVHTIKGTSGFLGYSKLEALTHAGEHLLSKLRDGEMLLTPERTSALLEMVDKVRAILRSIEATGAEGDLDCSASAERLRALSVLGAPAPDAIAAAPIDPPPEADEPLFAAASPQSASSEKPAIEAQQPAPSVQHAVEPAPHATSQQVASQPPTQQQEAPSPSMVAADGAGVSDSNVRVDVALLDRLMNLVGELVLARNQVLQFGAKAEDAAFTSAAQRLNLITTELQAGVMKTRMQPIGNVWNKLPRVARDLSIQCGKQVRIEMIGKETELDRTIIEAIKDPLTHIVRNAIDHGLEAPEVRAAAGKPRTGTLRLRAFHEGGQVNIEISDDGAGVRSDAVRAKAVQNGIVSAERAGRMSERELCQLVFLPGFSTAAKVTNVSGRGVGMDVVKTNIEKIGGTVDLQSSLGRGTTLRIKIPLTLAIVPALIVTSKGHRFAVPQVSLHELVRLEGEQVQKGIERIHGAPVYRLRGDLLPLVDLAQTLGLRDRRPPEARTSTPGEEVLNIVVVQADGRQFGLVVDEVKDTEEIVVKPLGKELKSVSVFAGATVMGDGRVALILDVLGLAVRAGANASARDRAQLEAAIASSAAANAVKVEEKQALLLFRVGPEGCMAMPLAMVSRLEEFRGEQFERAGQRGVVQYRGEILPLLELGPLLGTGSGRADAAMPVPVVVYSQNGRSIGLVVDRILDIVEDSLAVGHRISADCVQGAAVIQGRVTELLDVPAFIRKHEPGFFEARSA